MVKILGFRPGRTWSPNNLTSFEFGQVTYLLNILIFKLGIKILSS